MILSHTVMDVISGHIELSKVNPQNNPKFTAKDLPIEWNKREQEFKEHITLKHIGRQNSSINMNGVQGYVRHCTIPAVTTKQQQQ